MSEMTESESRLHPRKVFHIAAKLSVGEKALIDVQTLDISAGGICLMAPESVSFNSYAVLKFETTINGALRAFSAIGRSAYSIPQSTNEFKIGLQFVQLDPSNAALLNELLSQE